MNISAGTIDLSACKFTVGITFTFPANYLLPAGARCLLVENQPAFAAAFPSVSATLIAGTYSGSLSNGGERLLFLNSSNATLKDFTYDDAAPWVLPPDGTGPALVLIRPTTNPAHGTASNWRSSTTHGGSPGSADAPAYEAWQNANSLADFTGTVDTDGDGLANLIEYTLGLDPKTANPSGLVTGTTTVSSLPYLTLATTRPLGRDQIAYLVEYSTTLAPDWVPAILMSSTPDHLTGNLLEVYRAPVTSQDSARQFLRAKAILTP